MSFAPALAAAAPAIIQGVTSMFGRKKKAKRRSTLSPEQQKLHKDYIDALRGEGPMAGMFGFDPEKAGAAFEQNVSRPAYRQFQEDVIPKITGQFRGSNIGQSSYTGEALGRAGRDVQESLDAQRANTMYQAEQRAIDRRLAGANTALGTQTFAYERPQEKSNSSLDSILQTGANIGGNYLADKYSNYIYGR